MKIVLVGVGLLVVMGAPLGLLVVGFAVLRSAMRDGLRMAVAVAGVTFVLASLSFATALAHADVASHLDEAADCEPACDQKVHEAVDITPVRSLGRWLLGAAVVDALLLAWWWRRSTVIGLIGPRRMLLVVAGVAVALGAYMGARALAVPHQDALGTFDDTTHDELRLAVITLVTCAVGVLGAVLSLRPMRRRSF